MAESCVLGLFFERIRPSKLRKTGKIAVCRLQHATIFHCECGQLCVVVRGPRAYPATSKFLKMAQY